MRSTAHPTTGAGGGTGLPHGAQMWKNPHTALLSPKGAATRAPNPHQTMIPSASNSPETEREPRTQMSTRCSPRYGWVRSKWHSGLGRLFYGMGKLERARRHFERALALRGENPAAYEHLCEIAFQLGDWTSWCRELEHLRRLAPERHARLHRTQPFELLGPRTAGAMLAEPGNRATWRATDAPPAAHGPWSFIGDDGSGRSPQGRSAAGHGGPRRSVRTIRTSRMSGEASGEYASPQPPHPPRSDELLDDLPPPRGGSNDEGPDDFTSEEERQEFADRAPIAPDTMHPDDWAELLRRLTDESD